MKLSNRRESLSTEFRCELTKELDILAEDLFVNPKNIKNASKRYPISESNTK